MKEASNPQRKRPARSARPAAHPAVANAAPVQAPTLEQDVVFCLLTIREELARMTVAIDKILSHARARIAL